MAKRLLILGGVLNALFTLFHVYLTIQIHSITNLTRGAKTLMEMLSMGGTLSILLFTIASLFFTRDMIETALGKLLTWTVVVLYGWRASAEIYMTAQFSPVIFGSCLAVALLYLGVIVLATKAHPKPAVATANL